MPIIKDKRWRKGLPTKCSCSLVATIVCAMAMPVLGQMPNDGGSQPPMMQQALQDISRKLAYAHANSQSKTQILEHIRDRMTMRETFCFSWRRFCTECLAPAGWKTDHCD